MPDTTNRFTWKRLPEWSYVISGFMRANSHDDFQDVIRENRSEFVYVDDITPLEVLYEQDVGDFQDLIDSLTQHFPGQYPSICMFHCCRPRDVETYYSKGIQVLDVNWARDYAEMAFMNNPKCPDITLAELQAAFDRMSDSYRRHGFVYFGLDDRHLVQYCKHYLEFGSEYLQRIAGLLGAPSGHDYKEILREDGVPTVFEVNMPIDRFSGEDLHDLCREILCTWAYSVAHDRDIPRCIDFSIDIDHSLSPELIAGHYHPELK